MAEELQYDFNRMETVNTAIQQRLAEFRNHLEQYKKAYVEMAQFWGGAAAAGAGQVAQDLDKFGNGVADTVGVFRQRMVQHREESMAMEAQNASYFN
jgi:uncharacterized protein YukE